MDSQEDDVTALLKRTRAARERVNTKLSNLGETGHPIRSPLRSPLKERSNASPARTPIKTSSLAMSPSKLTTRTPSKLTTDDGPSSSYSRLQRSPLKRDESPVQTVFRQRSPSKRDDSPLRPRSPLKRDESPVTTRRSPVKRDESPRQRSPLKRDESPVRQRSPLKRDESPVRQRSPLKREETFTVRSPAKTTTTVTSYTSPEKSSQVSQKSGRDGDFHKETYNREVTEKKTTIDHSPVKDSASGVETFKKTVVTEKEETISKTEVLKFTEVGPGRVGELDPLKLLEERRNRRRQVAFDDKDKVHEISIVDSPAATSASSVGSASPGRRSMGSPSRFGSCRDLSPDKGNNGWTPNKATINYQFSTDEKDDKPEEEEDDRGVQGGAAGRKKRLNALASKFKAYDEDEEEIVTAKLVADAAVTQSSPEKRNQTKVVDVDAEIETSPRRGRSPTKRQANPHLFQSLKAQGYEESGESKSKLVYDFKKNSPAAAKQGYRSNSPVKSEGASSMNPHQFICPQQKQSSPAVNAAGGSGYRSVSPTRMLDPGKASAFTPHPLQFVSPKLAKSPVKAAASESVAPPPKKPQRVFSEPPMTTTPEDPVEKPVVTITKPAEQSDTASRRSMAEKRNLFETRSPARSDAGPDPALLPLSQRKALFEKNRGAAPVPIGRFGESVTPAMLAKTPSEPAARPRPEAPASEPAWKRKRQVSPIRNFATPKAPPPAGSEASPTRDLSSIHKRFENSRRLFENPKPGSLGGAQGPNDIARATQEARQKEMDVLRSRFKRTATEDSHKSPAKEEMPAAADDDDTYYPGVNSLKKIKVSPPKAGQMYPDLNDIYGTDSDRERPETAMSGESAAASEAPSLGAAIKRAASTSGMMPMITEDSVAVDDDDDSNDINDMLDEALDVSVSPSRSMASTSRLSPTRSMASTSRISPTRSHQRSPSRSPAKSPHRSPHRSPRRSPVRAALVSAASSEDSEAFEEMTPAPKSKLNNSSSSGEGSSAGSWEYSTPRTSLKKDGHDFKTPRVDGVASPQSSALPRVETENGEAKPAQDLMYTVSFYRKQRPGCSVNVTPHAKIVRDQSAAGTSSEEEDQEVKENEKTEEDLIAARIRKLQEEVDEQTQRRLQSSKALDVCASKNEFEGSYERVEFERLLLEAHHKYSAASAEIRRLKTEGARRMSQGSRKEEEPGKGKAASKGAISISGITLPLKPDFVRMVKQGGHDGVHYFLCLVKYRAQVIATQMLSTTDGITRGSNLVFSNLISVNDLDFDFQIYLEVYGLQTPKERLSHEAKYHLIRKGKSMFNLTPLKKLKRAAGVESGSGTTGRSNPVNSLTIRKSKFGLVGYATVTIDNLAGKSFALQAVPARSPLEGDLAMELNVHSECHIEERGFLTLFMDVNGFGNWCRRWSLLQDNTLYFWKYPEDEGKRAPSEQISLHNVVTETPVSLAPREICSRFNTFMLESQRATQSGDRDSLNIVAVDRKRGLTSVRYLLSADTRDERLNWCNVLTRTMENMRAWDPSTYRSRASSTTSDSTVATASSADANADNVSAASTDVW